MIAFFPSMGKYILEYYTIATVCCNIKCNVFFFPFFWGGWYLSVYRVRLKSSGCMDPVAYKSLQGRGDKPKKSYFLQNAREWWRGQSEEKWLSDCLEGDYSFNHYKSAILKSASIWPYPAQCVLSYLHRFILLLYNYRFMNSCNEEVTWTDKVRQNASSTHCVGSSKSMTTSKKIKNNTQGAFFSTMICTPLTRSTHSHEKWLMSLSCFLKLEKSAFHLSCFESSRLCVELDWVRDERKPKWKQSKKLFAICNPYPLGKCAYAREK